MEEHVQALARVLVLLDGRVLDVRQLFVHQHVRMVEHVQVLVLVHVRQLTVELDAQYVSVYFHCED